MSNRCGNCNRPCTDELHGGKDCHVNVDHGPTGGRCLICGSSRISVTTVGPYGGGEFYRCRNCGLIANDVAR